MDDLEHHAWGGQSFWMATCPPGLWVDDSAGRLTLVRVACFRIGVVPVTQGLYASITGTNPSRFWQPPDADRRPVESVTWSDAVRFCNALSLRAGLTPCYRMSRDAAPVERLDADGFRLLTEAEWCYAAAAGSRSRFSGADTAEAAGWFYGNSGRQTRPVGGMRANAWGISDMSGNVWEWCWDLFEVAPVGLDLPMFSISAGERVQRGGSWRDNPLLATLRHRSSAPPTAAGATVGFRIAR